MAQRKADNVLGDPILRHTDCGSLLTTRRLVFRHGRLGIDPLYCRRCGGSLTRYNIEPYNESARQILIKLDVIKDPAIPVPVDVQIDF